MSSQEVKGTLAKLLATENLIVEHRVVETASFDVDRRVLVLPIWDVTDRVYNMLVGHEVGHALYTPNTDWGDLSVPKSYINITEDARIEKLMKRKFPGLAKDFFKGYEELNEDDFFSVRDTEVEKLLLIDRINLYFKIGAHHMIPFNDAEIVLRDATGAAETFEEALSAAKAIYEYAQEQKEAEEQVSALAGETETMDINVDGSSGDSSGENRSEEGQETNNESKGQSQEDPEEGEGTDSETSEVGKSGGTEAGDLEARTDDALAQALKDKAQMSEQDRPKYLEIDNVDLKHHIVSPEEINKVSHETWNHPQYTDPNYEFHRDLDWSYVDSEYRKFKKECSREVNYLAKEFEMKKAATAFSRESIAKTGVIDTKKLFSYRYNEDLFKKVVVRPDGKNHGMIFLLDWSGSMAEVIHDTYKQLLSLCLFCRKSGIPFDVYAFVQDGQWVKPKETKDEWTGRPGTFHVPEYFYLLNFLNGKLNNQKFDQYARDLWRVTFMYHHRYSSRYRNPWSANTEPMPNVPDAFPSHLQLGGTPLNEAIACLQTLIPEFQAKSKVEKVHVAILSDGEAAYSAEWRESEWQGRKDINRSCIRYNTHLRDRRNGRTYAPTQHGGQGGCTTTNQLLRYLKGRFPQCNFLGFRIASNREVTRYLENEFYPKYNIIEKHKKTWSKNKSFGAPMMGYQELYFLNNKNLNTEVEFDPKSDSKADIKRAFTKSLKGKANNKKILSSFILQIA